MTTDNETEAVNKNAQYITSTLSSAPYQGSQDLAFWER